MAKIKSFEELPVWQIARKFTNETYILTNRFPKNEMFGLTSQIRRAAVSIGSNISEGLDRRTDKELTNILSMARGSCAEIQNDLYIAFDLKYISEIEFKKYYQDTKKIAQQLNGLMNYLRNA